ncbi:MAG: hypothetical protein HOP25_01985 [Methylotenera sp.]|nr:hypothetical protein [Methylotenera sp.]
MTNESAIEQINLGFNEPEDRLLLKVGLADKTEVAVWITRRICKAMWIALQGAGATLLPTSSQFAAPNIVTPNGKSEAIESFQKEAVVQNNLANLDFKSEYMADRQARSDAPMLAILCLVVTIGAQLPQLDLQCSNGQSVKILLTNELVRALTNMMQMATREAGWDLFVEAGNAQVSVMPNQQTVH